MDYKDRPIEERLDLARRYALLLMNERKSNKEILSILKRDYALTEEQAAQAFDAARSSYNQEPLFDDINKKLTFGGCLIFFLFSVCISSSSGIIQDNDIATIKDRIITAPLYMESTGGKNSQRYYVIKLSGRILPCRFFQYDYEFSAWPGRLKTIKEGDTVYVQILKKDLDLFYERNGYSVVNLINIDRGDGFLVNMADRNEQLKRYHRNTVFVTLFALVSIILILLIRIGIYFKNRR